MSTDGNDKKDDDAPNYNHHPALESRVRELRDEGFEPFTVSASDVKLYKSYERSPFKYLHALRFFPLLIFAFLWAPFNPPERVRRSVSRAGQGMSAHTLLVELSVDEGGSVREERVFFV